ncbi:HsdR family type I site-specific deoxyribonuclease [Mycoplasmopsis alligatoris]|uniref:Type I restriction enzyme endonuclease subunit n=1 Tax=Mycoplasmopsis alligatoris A21JP2 TaxID=747682 RepID=D4XV99_9BACT|nr:HsdR family type I site-specific deoxyribonuclease [Mycoplasmopsis alligatoris]EFF41741.1 type I site-specific deoxyribonuclease, HsdR family [Mycoplasmopsis alligatoris A21JP2]
MFTSYWSDSKNKPIHDIEDFTSTFFRKNTLLNILTKYCVFTHDNNLLVMRPYQIAATEKIISKVNNVFTYKTFNKQEKKGGFVWHTTGSGKTLTSFKTATLLGENEKVKKILFVVDRKDLDYQTIKEYEKYQKGAVSSNSNTTELKKNLEDDNKKIIVTTIQKLSKFIKSNSNHEIYKQNTVLIFDECHRSQFGEFNKLITEKSFKNFIIFGFTGTPIFLDNSGHKKNINIDQKVLLTTESIFGVLLHSYTIPEAIKDEKVLPFRIHYVNTIKSNYDIENDDQKVMAIDTKEALENIKRISKITEYILKNYDAPTCRNNKKYLTYINNDNNNLTRYINNGFNSILATHSIESAKMYYQQFKEQQKDLDDNKKLKVALIYSYSSNDSIEDNVSGIIDENNEMVESLDKVSRDFLDMAISDYNKMFNTTYSTRSDSFNNYYKDFSNRLKKNEIDIAIVVNMFLTGFDAPTLNTIWIDKKVKQHGLIQTISRTNRILNSIKSHGNVICFVNLEKQVNEAISLFSNKNNISANIIIMKTLKEYCEGYIDEYGQKVTDTMN